MVRDRSSGDTKLLLSSSLMLVVPGALLTSLLLLLRVNESIDCSGDDVDVDDDTLPPPFPNPSPLLRPSFVLLSAKRIVAVARR
jgi:hypothetical protein